MKMISEDQILSALEGYTGAAEEELRDAAEEVLALHPGVGFEEWRDILMEQYAEVADVYGDNPEDADRGLKVLWSSLSEGKTPGIEGGADA